MVETLDGEKEVLPKPVDEEGAAGILRNIEAETASLSKPVVHQPPAATLSFLEFLISIIRAPQRVFHEIGRRACPELLGTTLVILLLQPIINGQPNVSFGKNLLFLSVFFLLYALGRACLLILAARWFSRRLSLRTAYQGVLVNEVIYAVLLVSLLVMPSLQEMSGQIPYIRLGLGEWITPLGETNPVLFNYLAQLHVFTFWGFGLWWVGLATLAGVRMQNAS